MLICIFQAAKEQQLLKVDDDLEALLKKKYFVDKSLFIQEVLKSPAKICITAPSSWGKSTNLKILKKFLELQVDEEGQTITKATRKRHFVNDTDNYTFFKQYSLKITKNKKIMDRHFGKYPVVHVDFKCQHKIKDSEYSVICFREIIHKAITQHKYLCKSDKLTLKEKRFVEKWSDADGKYEEFYGQDVTKALYKLSILLNKQFSGRKLFVLIDNYDYPSSQAMFNVKDGKELNRVMKFNLNIISTVLSSGNKYQCKSVIMGKSYIAAAGVYKFEDTQYYRFLGNHTMHKYFGLSKKEVHELFTNSTPKIVKYDIDLYHTFYGGFVSLQGDNTYCFNSVFNFLNTRIIKTFTPKFDLMRYLKIFCKINFMREKIETLAKGNTIEMDSKEVFTINDLINLRDILSKTKSEERVPENILFSFLLEQGYLTNVISTQSIGSSMFSYELPNLEVKYMVGKKLKKYYDEIYLPNKALLTKCVDFFKSVSPYLTANLIHFKRALYWFYTSLQKLITFRWTNFSEKYVYRLLFSIVYHFDYKTIKDSFVSVSETNNQTNFLVVCKKIIFFIGLKVNESPRNILQNLVRNISSSHLKLVPLFRNRKRIYLSLGIDSKLILSSSCLQNGNDTRSAFHLP